MSDAALAIFARRITLAQVGDIAGCDRSLISLQLGGHRPIQERTLKAIYQITDDLEFVTEIKAMADRDSVVPS